MEFRIEEKPAFYLVGVSESLCNLKVSIWRFCQACRKHYRGTEGRDAFSAKYGALRDC